MVDKVCTNHNIRQERKGGGGHLHNASTFNNINDINDINDFIMEDIKKSFAFESMNTCKEDSPFQS